MFFTNLTAFLSVIRSQTNKVIINHYEVEQVTNSINMFIGTYHGIKYLITKNIRKCITIKSWAKNRYFIKKQIKKDDLKNKNLEMTMTILRD